jgi:hypothetical protein
MARLMHDPIAPHFAIPFRLDGDRFATVEDGSEDEVRQNVAVLVSTRVGTRLVVPNFGIPDPTFTTGGDANDILNAADIFEPRAALDVTIDDGPERTVTVHVGMEES